MQDKPLSGRIPRIPKDRSLGGNLPVGLGFVLSVVRRYLDNGGPTLAAALAHHMLLSAIPLLMITLTLFSRFVERERLVAVLAAEMAQVLPGDHARPVVDNALAFAERPELSGMLGLGSLFIFSTLAFRTLQRAIDIIFAHRGAHARRALWSSVAISVAYVLAIGAASLLQSLAWVGVGELLDRVGVHVPAATFGVSFAGLFVLLSSVYVVMPVGRVRLRGALWAGLWAAVAWAAMQRLLFLYLHTLSPVNWIFGSMARVIAVLISFEVLSTIVLLGAQAVSEGERLRSGPAA